MSRKPGRALRPFVPFIIISFVAACAPSTDSDLESLHFQLDKGDYASAVTTGEALVKSISGLADTTTTVVPANASTDELDARSLLSDAYFGRANLSLLDLVKVLTKVLDSTTAGLASDDFLEFRNAIANTLGKAVSDIGTTDMRNAAATLEVLQTNNTTALTTNKDVLGQLANLQAMEGFLLPVILAGDKATATITTNITAAQATVIENDFLNADDNYAASGTTNTSFLSPIRENYCRCELQTDGGTAVTGMTAKCIQDLMICELGTLQPQGDYNNDGATASSASAAVLAAGGTSATAAVAALAAGALDCAALLSPTSASTSACNGQNTTKGSF